MSEHPGFIGRLAAYVTAIGVIAGGIYGTIRFASGHLEERENMKRREARERDLARVLGEWKIWNESSRQAWEEFRTGIGMQEDEYFDPPLDFEIIRPGESDK